MTGQIKNVKHGPQVQTFYFLGSNAFAEKLEYQFLRRCGKTKIVQREICSCKWVVKENFSKTCEKLVPRPFVCKFFGAFISSQTLRASIFHLVPVYVPHFQLHVPLKVLFASHML